MIPADKREIDDQISHLAIAPNGDLLLRPDAHDRAEIGTVYTDQCAAFFAVRISPGRSCLSVDDVRESA